MYRDWTIAVVVPAHNEERHIAETIRSVPAWVDFVVAVDDASTDGTSDVLASFEDVRLHTLRLQPNRGVGGAILAGYDVAVELGAEAVAVMAGDGQMDPADLPKLLDPIVDGRADYVKGDRLDHPDLLRLMPPVRVVGNYALSALTRVVTGYWRVFDSQCGYTAIRAEIIPDLDSEAIYPRYGFPNDLLSHLATLGARVVDCPVRPIYGTEVSGIRLPTVLVTIPPLLLRSWLWRLWTMYGPARAQTRKTAPESWEEAE